MSWNGAKWVTAVAAVWIGVSGCGDETGDAVEASTTSDTGASGSGTTIDDDLGATMTVGSTQLPSASMPARTIVRKTPRSRAR